MGGEVVQDLLSKVDLDTLNKDLRRNLEAATTDLARTKLIKRLKVVESI